MGPWGSAPSAGHVDESGVRRFGELLGAARRVAFLTGAGMSTESGIPDFRSGTGTYATRASENIFDIDAFRRDPAPFYAFARTFVAEVMAARPNAGHLAITDVQDRLGKEVAVATQNIDLLHQQSGTRRVYPVHGTMENATCTDCGDQVRTATLWPVICAGGVPRHHCGGVYKPDIVFFGEMLPEMVLAGAREAFVAADLVVVLGTSLSVYPAAALPDVRRRGTPLVIVNRTATGLEDRAALVFHGAIGTILPAAVAAVAGGPRE